MKKIFTSLMLLGAAFIGASAQNFTITGLDDVTYADGDVVNIGYKAGQVPGRYTWDPELIVHVNKGTSLITGRSNFTMTASADVPGEVQFCGGGTCEVIRQTPITKTGTYGAGDIIVLQLDIANHTGILSEPVVSKLTVTDGAETVTLTVNFLTTEQAGLDTPQVTANSVNVSGRTLRYTVDGTESLALFNISGRTVINRPVSGTGTIDLSGVPAGVYVYRLGALTGKVLVH